MAQRNRLKKISKQSLPYAIIVEDSFMFGKSYSLLVLAKNKDQHKVGGLKKINLEKYKNDFVLEMELNETEMGFFREMKRNGIIERTVAKAFTDSDGFAIYEPVDRVDFFKVFVDTEKIKAKYIK